MKTPREALADARIRVHQCRNALAEALREERIADARMAAAVEAEGAPTVRPPPPTPAPLPAPGHTDLMVAPEDLEFEGWCNTPDSGDRMGFL